MNKPIIKELDLFVSPFQLFTNLVERYDTAYLLESIEGPEKLSEFSFLGFRPELRLVSKDGTTKIIHEDYSEVEYKNKDPLKILKEILVDYSIDSDSYRLMGGAVGYISYDAIRYWEKIPDTNLDDYGFPDIEMGIYTDGIIFDHKTNKAYYHYQKENRIEEIKNNIDKGKSGLKYSNLKTNIEKSFYKTGIEKAKEHISIGDIFQVVPSRRFELSIEGNLIHFYKALREINPSPYMYYLKMEQRQIIGASPEMLVRVENGIVETYPIAGTRPIVVDPEENIRLGEELLADPKERAEHIMLVDLARNDVGKVSEYGTVNVPDFMTIHQFSHVQHIVSRVTGKLRKTKDSFDALRAIFPAGTVSGAPKIKAMEIIDELEPSKRGPYAGAVGFFSLNGNADFAITIRTLVVNGNKAYIQAGGGIVADSLPDKEWLETEHKARGLLKAMELAGEIME